MQKNARNPITLLKYVCPNKQRELTISIMKANSSDENTSGFFVDFVFQSENPQTQNKTADKQYNIEMCSNQDDLEPVV